MKNLTNMLRKATRFNKFWLALSWALVVVQLVTLAFGPSWEKAGALFDVSLVAFLVTGWVYYQTKAMLREFTVYMLMAALDDDVASEAAQKIIADPGAVYARLTARADAARRVSAEDLIERGE